MVKNYFQNELSWTGSVGVNATGNSVVIVQEWLNLWYDIGQRNIGTSIEIDGHFGPVTRRAVEKFQKARELPITGIVDTETYLLLVKRLSKSFALDSYQQSDDMRSLVVEVAKRHYINGARELKYMHNGKEQGNMGPWVRSYCNGQSQQGELFFWCLGFVQTVLDIAYSKLNKQYTDFYLNTLSCDFFANQALNDQLLIRNEVLKNNASLMKKGDMFLIRKGNNPNDWKHVGIITQIIDHDDTIKTIEGNSNNDGSNNGYGVVARERNFRNSSAGIIDIVKLHF